MSVTMTPVSSTSGGALAKLTELKTLIGASDTAQDTLLSLLLTRATDQARQLSGATSIVRTSTTLYPFDPALAVNDGSPVLRLDHGVIESITSVKQRYVASEDWADIDALVADADYLVDQQVATIEAINVRWSAHRRQLVQVVGVFGYYDPNDNAPSADAIAPPQALQHGILEQAEWLWQRRDKIGTTAINLGQGGSMNLKDQETVQSLKDAVNHLPFRRII